MKKIILKIADVLKIIFGYGIMICLMVGGLTFFGYLAAIIIGGDAATSICIFISKKLYPVLVVISTSTILIGLITMYITGEANPKKDKNVPKENAADGQNN